MSARNGAESIIVLTWSPACLKGPPGSNPYSPQLSGSLLRCGPEYAMNLTSLNWLAQAGMPPTTTSYSTASHIGRPHLKVIRFTTGRPNVVHLVPVAASLHVLESNGDTRQVSGISGLVP